MTGELERIRRFREQAREGGVSIPTTTVRDLRDKALIAILTDSFACIGAALKMKVEGLRPKGAGLGNPAA